MRQYHEQEVGYASEQAVRPDNFATFFVTLASTSALDPVLNLGEPANSSADTLRLARRYCGRWLALRQLHLGLSNQEIAERTGVDAPTLLELELGLPETHCLTDEALKQFCSLFADAQHDAGFIAALIEVARGCSDDHEGVIMEQVMAALQPTLDNPEED